MRLRQPFQQVALDGESFEDASRRSDDCETSEPIEKNIGESRHTASHYADSRSARLSGMRQVRISHAAACERVGPRCRFRRAH